MPPNEADPIGADLRRVRRARRLPADAVCAICGRDDPRALRQVGRSALERHHVGGEANDGRLTVVLCLYCHRLQTASQPGMGVYLDNDPRRTEVEKLVSVLRGLGLFFQALAAALIGWADKLTDHIARLDANYPGWRDLDPGPT